MLESALGSDDYGTSLDDYGAFINDYEEAIEIFDTNEEDYQGITDSTEVDDAIDNRNEDKSD